MDNFLILGEGWVKVFLEKLIILLDMSYNGGKMLFAMQLEF